MAWIRRWAVLLALVAAAPGAALADTLSAEKRADIERLLEMTGALAIGQQMALATAAQFADAIKKVRPDIPQKLLDAVPHEIEAVFEANLDSFKAAMIPLYDKYFSAAEIKEMIRFYSTDLGRKVVRVLPALTQESMVVGSQWGQALAPQIEQRIRARFKRDGIRI
jgi:hypothetical protein